MQFDVITLFPKMFEGPFGESMIKRAIDKGIINIKLHDMRQWAWNSYGAVDDKPFGGGVGMLIRADVVGKALETLCPDLNRDISLQKGNLKRKIILTSARGKRFNQQKAEELAKLDKIILICGHYEGFDERVRKMADEEVSIGDYVLTGGELAAMVMIDVVSRLIPGVLGKDESNKEESFSERLIKGKKVRVPEYPQYTRPAVFRGEKVPEVLLGGNPKKIKEWQERVSSIKY